MPSSKARKPEQTDMFAKRADDLPLFAGTVYHGKEKEKRNVEGQVPLGSIPLFGCKVCLGTGYTVNKKGRQIACLFCEEGEAWSDKQSQDSQLSPVSLTSGT